jgi:hypothetical protein
MTNNWYPNCLHDWTEPQHGTIRETGEGITGNQCVHCGAWLIEHDKPGLTTRWPITIDLDGSTLIAPGPNRA